MRNENCIFCKIAAGEIPSATLYEDEDFRVFLDLGPANDGHALIIPKEHYANILELPEELCGKAMVIAKKLAKRLKDFTGADGVNIVNNNGEAAGQSVFHFHVHVIPRWKNDGKFPLWIPGELTDEVRDKLVEEFKKNPLV